MVKVVIFDLDDTLISEKQYIESGYRHIAKILATKYKFSKEEIYSELIRLFDESPKNVFNRFLDGKNIYYTKKIIIELVEEYRNHFPEISFYDDVLFCLTRLKSQNIKIGIITDGYVNAQRQKLKALKAYDYFDEIIITDELGREYWKPNLKAFELMKSKLNVEFNEMVYIGDNPEKDFYIGKTHSIMTVRILRNGVHQYKSYLEDVKEEYLIKGLNEIEPILNP